MSHAAHVHRDTSPQNPDHGHTEDRVYAHQRRAFEIHAVVFGLGMVIIFLVNALTNIAAGVADEWSAWWSIWALIGWGLGVAVHGLVVRLARPETASKSEGA